VGANVGAGLVERVIVERKVCGHAAARVNLLDEIPGRIIQRMVDIHGVVEEEFGQSVLEQIDASQIGLEFGDKNIDALGVLFRQFVRAAVAGPHERKAVPVQTVGRGAVLYV